MLTRDEIEKKLETEFNQLPTKMKVAARYVLNSPVQIAMNSMRTSAANAGVQPAVMLRLARYLGFDSFDSFRACYQAWVSSPAETLYKRAEALTRRTGAGHEQKLIADILNTTVRNIGETLGEKNLDALYKTVELIKNAKKNYVLGVRSLFPVAYTLHYSCNTIFDNFFLLGGFGQTIIDEVRRIGKEDVLTVFSFFPYSNTASAVAEFASERGAHVIAITDSVVSPVARCANISILSPTSSPTMFPSILPAMVVAESLSALLVAGEKQRGLAQVQDIHAQLVRFNVFTKS